MSQVCSKRVAYGAWGQPTVATEGMSVASLWIYKAISTILPLKRSGFAVGDGWGEGLDEVLSELMRPH